MMKQHSTIILEGVASRCLAGLAEEVSKLAGKVKSFLEGLLDLAAANEHATGAFAEVTLDEVALDQGPVDTIGLTLDHALDQWRSRDSPTQGSGLGITECPRRAPCMR